MSARVKHSQDPDGTAYRVQRLLGDASAITLRPSPPPRCNVGSKQIQTNCHENRRQRHRRSGRPLIHIYIVYLEMFLWTTPEGTKAFGITADFAQQSESACANQGLYKRLSRRRTHLGDLLRAMSQASKSSCSSSPAYWSRGSTAPPPRRRKSSTFRHCLPSWHRRPAVGVAAEQAIWLGRQHRREAVPPALQAAARIRRHHRPPWPPPAAATIARHAMQAAGHRQSLAALQPARIMRWHRPAPTDVSRQQHDARQYGENQQRSCQQRVPSDWKHQIQAPHRARTVRPPRQRAPPAANTALAQTVSSATPASAAK